MRGSGSCGPGSGGSRHVGGEYQQYESASPRERLMVATAIFVFLMLIGVIPSPFSG